MTEREFYAYVEKVVGRLLEQMPVAATYLGVHAYDHRLADFSPAGIKKNYATIREGLAGLEAPDRPGFSKEAEIDRLVVAHLLEYLATRHKRVAEHRRNPSFYVEEFMDGIFGLMIKDFAPLERRLSGILGRVRETPRVLAEGRRNLEPKLVPPVWAEMALEQARTGPALLESFLPALAGDCPGIKEDLETAGREAAAALRDFAAYLENDLVHAANGDFAAGEEYFNILLHRQHLVDYDAAALLDTGRRLFAETQKKMEAVAREIDPDRSAAEILEEAKNDHPAAANLLDEYRRFMEESRRFVVDQDIATIPGGETLQVIETPAFLRPIVPYAAYVPPGIFEQDLSGTFLVTPPEPDASPEEREEKLKGQPYFKLPVTALHEGYPGHHLQLAWAARTGSTGRKLGMLLSALFVEGWAFYCEELMDELGFINTPLQKLGRLTDQLLRAARIILDVSLHCRGMGVQEAVDFLVEKCGLQPGDALAEVRRYTRTPTQPQSYLMGKLEILKLVDEYRKRFPDASQRRMHDAILECGSLPPRLMRRQLFS